MRNLIAPSVSPLVLILLTQISAAQPANEIRDPEVLSPSPPQVGQPCVVDASALQDRRINREVLRVMQTDPYFVPEKRNRIARVVYTYTLGGDFWMVDKKIKNLGCGFYIVDDLTTAKERDGATVKLATITFKGPTGETLFSETTITYFSAGGRVRKVVPRWTQMVRLQVIGIKTPFVVGKRYGYSETTKSEYGGYDFSYECRTTQQWPASTFNIRLSGDAFVETCKVSLSGAKPDISTRKSVSFPSTPNAPNFDPDKCRLEWRAASEFHPRLAGDAFVAHCASGQSSSVSFSAIPGLSFDPDNCRLELRAASEFNSALHDVAYVQRSEKNQPNVISNVFFPELDESYSVDPTASRESSKLVIIELAH